MNKNGQIEASDFRELTDQMAALGGMSQDCPEYHTIKKGFAMQWQGLLSSDKNGNGVVSYEEWWTYWDQIINSEHYERATRLIAETSFAFCQPDAKGNVSKANFVTVSSAHVAY